VAQDERWSAEEITDLPFVLCLQLVDYNFMAFATALFAPFMADFKRYAKKES
jgi:hypothetical protein